MRDFSAPFFRRAGVADKARRAPRPRPPAAPPVMPRSACGGSAGQGRPSARARAVLPPCEAGAPAGLASCHSVIASALPCVSCMLSTTQESRVTFISEPCSLVPRPGGGGPGAGQRVDREAGGARRALRPRLPGRGQGRLPGLLPAGAARRLHHPDPDTTPAFSRFMACRSSRAQCDMKVARLAAGGEGLAAAGTSSAYCAGVTSPASHSMFIIRRESGESEERTGGVPANATWIDIWPFAWCATTSPC